MSITEDFATQWDNPKALQMVVPQQDRNFHRPAELRNHSTVPLDDNMAQDFSQIKEIKEFFQKGPLGVYYSGPIDNEINPPLVYSLEKLKKEISKKFPSKNFKFFTMGFSSEEDEVNFDDFNEFKAMTEQDPSLMKGPKETLEDLDDEDQEEPSENQQDIENIKKFQKLFNLPQTGEIDPRLEAAAKYAEDKISEAIEHSVTGMIWNQKNKTFSTTPEDVKASLLIIKNFT